MWLYIEKARMAIDCNILQKIGISLESYDWEYEICQPLKEYVVYGVESPDVPYIYLADFDTEKEAKDYIKKLIKDNLQY